MSGPIGNTRARDAWSENGIKAIDALLAERDKLKAQRDAALALVEKLPHDKDLSSLCQPGGAMAGMSTVIFVSKEMRDQCPCKPDCLRCEFAAIWAEAERER